MNLLGRPALSGSPVGMLVLGTVSALVITGGFILGVVAFFARKGEQTGTLGKAIAGIFINGLLISFAILSISTRQKVPARSENTPHPPRKGSSYISGK
jgi:hypothetical protein